LTTRWPRVRLEECQGTGPDEEKKKDGHKYTPGHERGSVIAGNEVGCKDAGEELGKGGGDAEDRAEETEGDGEVEKVFSGRGANSDKKTAEGIGDEQTKDELRG